MAAPRFSYASDTSESPCGVKPLARTSIAPWPPSEIGKPWWTWQRVVDGPIESLPKPVPR